MSPAAVAWHAAEGIFQICADTWTVAFVLLVLLVLAARTAARIRRRGQVGDDTLTMLADEGMERLITGEDIAWLESVGATLDTEGQQ